MRKIKNIIAKVKGQKSEQVKNPFKRVEMQNYYTISDTGKVECYTDCMDEYDGAFYNCANYCTDKNMMQQQAYQMRLNMLLWKFSKENGGSAIDWDDLDQRKWSICFDKTISGNRYSFSFWRTECERELGAVYFINQHIVQRAIDEIVKPFIEQHPNFRI